MTVHAVGSRAATLTDPRAHAAPRTASTPRLRVLPEFARALLALLALVVAAEFTTLRGQDLDLQEGVNFADGVPFFGAGRSDAVEAGDVDNDGDVDVGIANGSLGGPQANALWINQGGAQGGTQGDFVDESAVRLAGAPLDTSRDLEFADFDDDGDLDLFVANSGNVLAGEVSRAFLNQGGRQHGTVGVFVEGTDAFWGATLSVPAEDQPGVADDTGPWLGWGHDADFADVDDDGDLDLLHVTAGVNFNGVEPSRIFLNDGTGRFDELFPWADDAADVAWHSVDADFADLDGDFDLDLFASSRNSQSRVFRNETAEGLPGGRLFTDVTGSALLATGAAQQSSATYEVELADLDGDGDFDAWMTNYDGPVFGVLDAILVNRGDLTFERSEIQLIRGDFGVDERDADVLDFDGDGDLDVLSANYLGTNWLYTSGLADGLTPAQGLYHHTGTSFDGSLAPGAELPDSGNGGLSTEVAVADFDGDGDPDLAFANDSQQQNRYLENVLGVPDTFAPTLFAWTDQPDKADGSPTPIHAAVRDNTNATVIAFHRGSLVFSVDGGPETCVRLVHQGGQQFRGVIPAALAGTVAYRVEITDDAGNTFVSPTRSYVQAAPGSSPVLPVGCGTEGVAGVPVLEAAGDLSPGSTTRITLRHAAPDAFALLFLALQSNPVPFKQGTLQAFPVNAFVNRSTDAGGLDALDVVGLDATQLPSGLQIWLQYGVQDASVPAAGASLSNAVRLEIP